MKNVTRQLIGSIRVTNSKRKLFVLGNEQIPNFSHELVNINKDASQGRVKIKHTHKEDCLKKEFLKKNEQEET